MLRRLKSPQRISRRVLFVAVSSITLAAQFSWLGVLPASADSNSPELISQSTNGEPANDFSYGAHVSDNGRYIAFISNATNLGAQELDACGEGLYVRDRQAGTTTLESVDSNSQPQDGCIGTYSLSGDGRHLAFTTNAPNMDPNSAPNSGKTSVYVRNLDTGITSLVSIDNNGERLYPSSGVSLSYDGITAVFSVGLQSIEDGNETLASIYLHDMQNSTTEQIIQNQIPQTPRISGDGNKILYTSARKQDCPGCESGNSVSDKAMVYDRSTGTSTIARFNTDGSANMSHSNATAISYDGRYVIATGEDCGDNDYCTFRSDMTNHATKVLDVSDCGGPYGISADGSLTVIYDNSGDTPGECTGVPQSYIYNINTDTQYLVSKDADGNPADSEVDEPSMSADGKVVAFATAASNFGADLTQVYAVNFALPSDSTPPTLGTPAWSTNPITTTQSTSLTVPVSDGSSGVAGGEYYIGSTDPGNGNATAMTYGGGNLTANFAANSLSPGTYTIHVRAVDNAGNWSNPTTTTLTVQNARQLSILDPAKVWVGLKTSDDVGVKFDLLAQAYAGNTLVSSGELDSVAAGSSGFNNAKLDTIPFNSFSPVDFPSGTQLKIVVSARNACTGSGHNTGTARLWYNDSAANSLFGASIGNSESPYYLLSGNNLSISAGSGPKATVDVQSGAKCSAFKPFGTWSVTP